MWTRFHPIKTGWPADPIQPKEVLYEFDGPVFFVATIGLADYFFFKKDELEQSDLFIVCAVNQLELDAVKQGRLSIRGALAERIGWIIEMDFRNIVLRYQEQTAEDFQTLVPASGLALYSRFGELPDMLAQADAYPKLNRIADSL